jgi:predicted nucleic acid-binding protein
VQTLITYLDSSVVLRIVLGAPEPLVGWEEIEHAISSRLLDVECQRTLERMRLAEKKPAEVIAGHKKSVEAFMSAVDLFDVTNGILQRAGERFVAPLKTLDAIHLATALAFREERRQEVAFATHDEKLARAAEAAGFKVLGAA